MKKFAIIAAIVGFTLGVFLKGSLVHLWILLLLAVYLGLPVILFMGIWLVIGLRKLGMVPNRLKSTFAVFAIIAKPIGLLRNLVTKTKSLKYEINRKCRHGFLSPRH